MSWRATPVSLRQSIGLQLQIFLDFFFMVILSNIYAKNLEHKAIAEV